MTTDERAHTNTPITRSVDCSDTVDQWLKAGKFRLNVNQFLFMGMSLAYSAFIIKCKELTLGLIAFITVVLIAFGLCVLSSYLQYRKMKAEYQKYKDYCDTEVLFADNEKIYGSTTSGSLQLRYDQIASAEVRMKSNTTKKAEAFLNSIVEIEDIVGNTYDFYSFGNCKELKAVIDNKRSGGKVK